MQSPMTNEQDDSVGGINNDHLDEDEDVDLGVEDLTPPEYESSDEDLDTIIPPIGLFGDVEVEGWHDNLSSYDKKYRNAWEKIGAMVGK